MNNKKSPQSIIISGKPGQLGNMLFLFAHFIAFGFEKNISIKSPAFEEYADWFCSTRKTLVPSYPQTNSAISNKWLRKFIYMLSFLIAKIIFKLKLNNRLFSSVSIEWNEPVDLENDVKLKLFESRYTFIQGWLYRSNTLIQKHRDIVVKFFAPCDIYLDSINNLISAPHEVLVGIHIRQGDYKTFESGKYFFEINQYLLLMKKALTLLSGKKVLFLISSNSNLRHEDFSGMPSIFGTGVAIEDMYAFAKCNYLIGPPSTFTMWASFYGEVPLYKVYKPEAEFILEDFKVNLG